MLISKIFTIIGFAFVLFAAVYWGPRVFVPIMKVLGSLIKSILMTFSRTFFVGVLILGLIKANFVTINPQQDILEELITVVAGIGFMSAVGFDLLGLVLGPKKQPIP